MKFHQTKMALCSLSIYRNLLNDTVIKKFIQLINCLCAEGDAAAFLNLYNDFFFTLVSSDTSFANHIIDQITYDENPFSHRCTTGEEWSQITDAARRDLESLQHMAEISSAEIKTQAQIIYGLQESLLSGLPEWEVCNGQQQRANNPSGSSGLPEWKIHNSQGAAFLDIQYAAVASGLSERESHRADNLMKDSAAYQAVSDPLEGEFHRDPISNSLGQQIEIKKRLCRSSNWSDCLSDLAHFYRTAGAGIFAQYHALIWERSENSGFLKGVAYPDSVKLSDLFNYENERAEILENTLQFLKGCPANNVLLYGNRGTGKSSTVKAMANEYHSYGLRIIEVPKAYLSDFPEIIRHLRGRTQKFIIFVDDLTFEDSTANYTALKAVLEGGLESRPSNVLIYATSNRRHLIKESFGDRFEPLGDDEIHKNDGVQEKLSLADRFGITVIFAAPDQERYLEIVSSIAEQRSIKMADKDLNKEALKWAARHNGFSPRTARQFIDWLEGHLACAEPRCPNGR